jgi:ABC-type nitrate/sulfonate/bicarbonate transport system substrate-binding protein
MDAIKTVGSCEQISLGKKYAGQTVILSELDKGVWPVKPGCFIPENEKWLQAPEVQTEFQEAIAWAEDNPTANTDLDSSE